LNLLFLYDFRLKCFEIVINTMDLVYSLGQVFTFGLINTLILMDSSHHIPNILPSLIFDDLLELFNQLVNIHQFIDLLLDIIEYPFFSDLDDLVNELLTSIYENVFLLFQTIIKNMFNFILINFILLDQFLMDFI